MFLTLMRVDVRTYVCERSFSCKHAWSPQTAPETPAAAGSTHEHVPNNWDETRGCGRTMTAVLVTVPHSAPAWLPIEAFTRACSSSWLAENTSGGRILGGGGAGAAHADCAPGRVQLPFR